MTTDSQLKSFAHCLHNSKKILCIVGAGLSASSGVPTYQANSGRWKNYTSLDLATIEGFQENPGLVWMFYSSRRYLAMKSKPNNGHYALAELARKLETNKSKHILIVTQNLDGLHQRAGQLDKHLVELHGSLFEYKCTEFCCNFTGKNTKDHFLTPKLKEYTPKEYPTTYKKSCLKRVRNDDDLEIIIHKKLKLSINEDALIKIKNACGKISTDLDPLPYIDKKDLPLCPRCKNGLLRPGVVWYGESLPLLQVDKVDNFLSTGEKVDLVLVIGTSGKIWPAMGYVEQVKKSGGKVAIFNTNIDLQGMHNQNKYVWNFRGNAAEWLPKALEPIIGKYYKPKDWKKR